jgi:probable F420-dependent oxidoreductase
MMHVGITLPTYRRLATRENIEVTADKADAYGFHSVWVADHVVVAEEYVDKLGAVFYEALTTLSYVAGRTQRVLLGSSIMPIAYRHPLLQAKIIATLDQLSGGRALYCGAAGYTAGEFTALGLDVRQRGRIADEYLQAMKVAWTQEQPVFNGTFVQFEDVRCDPKPVQQPYPPVWIGGDSDPAFRRVVRHGDGWHGQVFGDLDLLRQRIERLHQIAREEGRDPASVRVSVKGDCQIFDDGKELPVSRRRPFFGTAEQVVDDLRQAEALGIELVVFSSNVAPGNQRMETIDALGRDVLPRLRREAGGYD